MSQPNAPAVDLDQLDAQGYTVVKGLLDPGACDALRAHMDDLLDPPAPPDDAEARRINMLRHPIPGDIMAAVGARDPLLNVAAAIVYSTPDRLRMLEQVLIRTDPGAPPADGPKPLDQLGWHIDQAFFPRHYDARPRQTYFHIVHALADVDDGQAATHLVPGSHKLTYAATAKLDTEEQLAEFKKAPIANAGIDVQRAITVNPRKGDALVFNPMCLHAASPNVSSNSRYVYFASFMDESAADLMRWMKSINYLKQGFPDTLRDAMPPERRHLVTWWPEQPAAA